MAAEGCLLRCRLGLPKVVPLARACAMPLSRAPLVSGVRSPRRRANIPASARPVGVVMAKAFVSETKSMPRSAKAVRLLALRQNVRDPLCGAVFFYLRVPRLFFGNSQVLPGCVPGTQGPVPSNSEQILGPRRRPGDSSLRGGRRHVGEQIHSSVSVSESQVSTTRCGPSNSSSWKRPSV